MTVKEATERVNKRIADDLAIVRADPEWCAANEERWAARVALEATPEGKAYAKARERMYAATERLFPK